MSVARLVALAVTFALVALLATPSFSSAQPAPPPAQAPAPKPGDPFGEEVTLAAKTIVYSKGSANWDSAFDTLVDSFKKIYDALEKQGLKASGPAMTIYTATDDTGFEYQAGVPVRCSRYPEITPIAASGVQQANTHSSTAASPWGRSSVTIRHNTSGHE